MSSAVGHRSGRASGRGSHCTISPRPSPGSPLRSGRCPFVPPRPSDQDDPTRRFHSRNLRSPSASVHRAQPRYTPRWPLRHCAEWPNHGRLTEQYQLFETSQYKYRVFVTDMRDPIYFVIWFYGQRGGAENLIKEANNDAGLAAHPSSRFDVNGNHFQLAMLAYNLNCWLMLFNREPQADATELRHTTLATSRLRFLFVAAKIWRHAGRTGVSYSDHYEEKGVFERLMDRLRRILPRGQAYAVVMLPALR